MPSALAFVAGGLLSGIGKGLVLTGKQKYERAMKRFEQEGAHKRALERDEKQLEGRRGLLAERLQSDSDLFAKREAGATERLELNIGSREKLAGEATTSRESLASEATASREKIASEANISRENVAKIAAGKATDTSAAEKRAFDNLIKINTETDLDGIETTDWNAVADGLEGKGFGKLAKAARSRGKGIADLELRQRAEEFADQMVEEQAGAFSFDSSDFKEDGGSRVRFRARMVREFIAKNGGEGTAAPAIKPAEEPATKPAETPAIKPAEAGPYVGDTPPPNAPDARKSPNDGYWYVKRDGKWQQVQK